MSEQTKHLIVHHAAMAAIGGICYNGMELLWRGRTHWSMFLVGGICFELIGRIHTRLWDRPLVLRCALCSLAVTAVELVSGCIVNRWLGLGVWDYSGMRYHILGQVCLAYSLLWMLLSAVACPLYRMVNRMVERFFAL